MNVRHALKEQYHGGLAMLAECVEKCPSDLWTKPGPCVQDDDRTITRSFERIAFHAAYFTQLYMGQDEAAFQPWPGRRLGWHEGMWQKPWGLEPYEIPQDAEPHSPQEILNYIRFVDSIVDATVDGLDLDREDTGFPWYKNMTKLSHELMNLRHIQGHVGQLSELLMARDIDIDWIGRLRQPT